MSWLLIAVVLLANASEAQLSQTSEKIEVNIVEVDVVVLDAEGKPVPSLVSNDFELRVGGRRRTITNFYEVNRRTAEPSPASTTAEAAPVARRDYLVLFIDDLHLNQHEKKRALDALRDFVQQHVRSGTAAMLVASDGDVRILQRFTEAPSLVIREIDRLEREPTHVSEYESDRRELLRLIDMSRETKENSEIARQQIDSLARHEQLMTERTIGALDRMIHNVQGLDGRRMLVYVSDGLPMQPGAEIFQYYKPDEFLNGGSSDAAKRIVAQAQPFDAMSVNLNGTFLQLARQAALAGVQFFAIDARGVQSVDDTKLDSSLIRSNLHGPIRLLADETGGQAIIDTNDMNLAFEKLDEHLSSYYSLGFLSESTDREDDVSVTVRQRGLTARAVKHVKQRSAREQIADRVRAGLYAHSEENPLDARIALTPSPGSFRATVRVPLPKLSIMPGEQTSFTVLVAMLDKDMRETPVRMFLHRVAPSESQDSVQSLTLNAAPGTYIVSFAIADSYSSQVSYFQQEVTIPPN